MKFNRGVPIFDYTNDLRLWHIHTSNLPMSLYGQCDYDARTIKVASRLRDMGKAYWTLVHEVIHSTLGPNISEECVNNLEENLKRATSAVFFMELSLESADQRYVFPQ